MTNTVTSKETSENYLASLYNILTTHFNTGELLLLCLNLGVDYRDLPGEGKTDKTRELLSQLDQRGRVPELVDLGKHLRPDIAWESRLAETEEFSSAHHTPAQRLFERSRSLAGVGRLGRKRPQAEGGSLFGRLLLLLLIASLGGCLLAGLTAWASQAALPGQPLYRVKQLTEDAQRLFATSARQRAALEQHLAARRLEELQLCAQNECGLEALARFDAALTEAILALTQVPPDERGSLQADLAALAACRREHCTANRSPT